MQTVATTQHGVAMTLRGGHLLFPAMMPMILFMLLGWTATAASYEGFGAAATGGTGHPTYRVTTCANDTRPGSLRDAVSQEKRHIVFEVACGPGSGNPLVNFGNSWVYIRSHTTLAGETAPAPGYQYLGTLAIGGQKCSPLCHNVIVRHMIYRPDGQTVTNFALKVERGAHTIVFDHNTLEGCGNDCIGISANEVVGGKTRYVDTRDITVSRNLINHPFRIDPGAEGTERGAETAMLVTNRARRISVLYNLIYDSKRRNPRIMYDAAVNPTDTVVEIRHNLIYLVSGTLVQDGGIQLYDRVRGNVVNNYIKAKAGVTTAAHKKGMMVCRPDSHAEERPFCRTRAPVEKVYVAGNISDDGWSIFFNSKGTTKTPQPTPAGSTMDACTAAQSVREDVGAQHKNDSDRKGLASIILRGCQS